MACCVAMCTTITTWCDSSRVSAVRFMLDGENIGPEATPAELDLDDDDQIDCFLAQVGGAR